MFLDKAKWERKLEFEGGTDKTGPALRQKVGSDNCYRIGGRVQVFQVCFFRIWIV